MSSHSSHTWSTTWLSSLPLLSSYITHHGDGLGYSPVDGTQLRIPKRSALGLSRNFVDDFMVSCCSRISCLVSF
ncbi:hypothetical protein DFH27DRAFT_578607 [Peziza echinospora]|nr:hypothetical protein DFH27DRAFT_578607 [Peziza echinospora]